MTLHGVHTNTVAFSPSVLSSVVSVLTITDAHAPHERLKKRFTVNDTQSYYFISFLFFFFFSSDHFFFSCFLHFFIFSFSFSLIPIFLQFFKFSVLLNVFIFLLYNHVLHIFFEKHSSSFLFFFLRMGVGPANSPTGERRANLYLKKEGPTPTKEASS